MIKFLLPLFLMFCPLAWGFAQYDSSASGSSASASSISFTHTNNGNLLFVFTIANGNNNASGVTYNNISMVDYNDTVTANGYTTDIWYLSGNIPKGANTVKVSYAGLTADILAVSASYTGIGTGKGAADSAPPYNGKTGEESDGITDGSSTTASSGALSLFYKNDIGIYCVFSLVTGTEATSGGTLRLDVTGTLVRADLFDLYPATNSALTATVGNGAWWLGYDVSASNKGIERFLKKS